MNNLFRANTLVFDDYEDDDNEMQSFRSFSGSSSDSSSSDSPYNYFSKRSPNPPPPPPPLQRQQQNPQEFFGMFEKLVDRLQQTLKDGLEKQTNELKKIITDQTRVKDPGYDPDTALKKSYRALCEGAFVLLFQTKKRLDSDSKEALREALRMHSLEFTGSRSQKLQELAKGPLTCPILLHEAASSLSKQRHITNKLCLASCGRCWPQVLRLPFHAYLDSNLKKGALEIGAGDSSYSASAPASASSSGSDNTGTKRKYTKKKGDHEALLGAKAAWKQFFDDEYTNTQIDPFNTWFLRACAEFEENFGRKEGLTTSDWAYIAATVRLYLEGCHMQTYIYISRELYNWLLDVCNHYKDNPRELQNFLEADKPKDRRSTIFDWPLPVGLRKQIQSHLAIDDSTIGKAESVERHLAESLVPNQSGSSSKRQQTASSASRRQPTAAPLNRTTSAPAAVMEGDQEEQVEEEEEEEQLNLSKKKGRPPKSQSTSKSQNQISDARGKQVAEEKEEPAAKKKGRPPKSQSTSKAGSRRNLQASKKLPQPPDSDSDSEPESEEIGTAEAIAAGHAALTAMQKRKRDAKSSSTASPPLKRRKTMG